MGMDTSEQDMNNIVIFTDRMISLALYRKQVRAQSCSTDQYRSSSSSLRSPIRPRTLLEPPIQPLPVSPSP
jgi:hypothetical protein